MGWYHLGISFVDVIKDGSITTAYFTSITLAFMDYDASEIHNIYPHSSSQGPNIGRVSVFRSSFIWIGHYYYSWIQHKE